MIDELPDRLAERVAAAVAERLGTEGADRHEVGFKDGAGKQRWRTVEGGITAARALRDELLARRNRGERVATDGRLGFAEAGAKWLNGPVLDLRPRTRECYRNAIEQHLLPSFGNRRLDAISPDDLALLVRELRTVGLSESSIVIVIGVTNRVYGYAARRLGWSGTNPVSLMLPSERPKPSQGKRRRIFDWRELEQTIMAAAEPYRTLFTLAALTGARLSELLGLTWADMRLVDLDDSEIEFGWQVDRRGARQPTKTDGSARTVPIPKELARMLARHKLGSRFSQPSDFVFCARTGRPIGQRTRRASCRARSSRQPTRTRNPTFPALHEQDDEGRPLRLPHGALPSMHSFRHTVSAAGLINWDLIAVETHVMSDHHRPPGFDRQAPPEPDGVVSDVDQRILEYMACHPLLLVSHVQRLLNVEEPLATRRLSALTAAGLVSYGPRP